ncbi:MAG: type II toxin-antitoxin system HicB family antitoxin [Planctomycetota bacterium]|nr:type II toxin-antitoxin system HicB family antitoxin [Planctomycetota bacterium]
MEYTRVEPGPDQDAQCNRLGAGAAASLSPGVPAPRPTAAEQHRASYPEWIVAVVTVDRDRLDDQRERVNITLPRRVLARLDAKAREQGETRSGSIAKVAIG